MTATIVIHVSGTPAPQGSKTHVGGGRMIESSKKVKPWRRAVVAAAMPHTVKHGTQDGPLNVTIEFSLRMPKSRPAKTRRHGWNWSTVPPDLDKLVRSTLDGLTESGLITDDARVCELTASKRETTGPEGAVITITHSSLVV